MSRKHVLVTGGNSGIGFECARELARQGCHVVMASRNVEASRAALSTIHGESGSDSASAMELDLGSLDSVRAFARTVVERDLPLQALVCNAGVQFNKERRRSPEGHEMTFAVNHLGHFLLVHLLLERLLRNAPARIVVVASGVHDPQMKTGMPHPRYQNIEDIAGNGGSPEEAYDGRLAYVNSKLCNVWFTYELQRRLEAAGIAGEERRLTVNAYDPGLVPGSGLARDYPPALRFVWNAILPAMAHVATMITPTINPAPKSGKALAGLVLRPEFAAVSGKYFPSHSRWSAADSSRASYDAAPAERLWNLSLAMTGLTPADSPLVSPVPAS